MSTVLTWFSGRCGPCKSSKESSILSHVSNLQTVYVTHMAKKKVKDLKVDPVTSTVVQVQAAMVDMVRKGYSTTCPCCKQVVAIQERDLSPMMAKVLIVLFHRAQVSSDWLHVSTIIEEENKASAEIRGNEWTKLTSWGLLEDKSKKDARSSGLYKVTEKGMQFVRGETMVNRALRIYNGKFLGFEDGMVSIKDCLGATYDYDKLMSGQYLDFAV